jgi:hypothetical protein
VVKNISIIFLLLAIFFSSITRLSSQVLEPGPDTLNKKRLNTVLYTGAGLYAGTLGVLYFAWYQDNEISNFHWYNDSKGWMQVDKFGHATTAYIITNYAYWSLDWAGVDNNKAAIYGGLIGWGSMTVIEILDSFSEEWGASPSDLVANTIGSAFFTGQQLLWKEQRFSLKFSYHPTDYAQYRPDLLGENELQRSLKDYNGQTYWLSMNIKSFLREESKFPPWLNVAFGYGAKGMLGTFSNPQEWNGNELPYEKRTRQYYMTMDIDWTRIETNSALLRLVFKAFSFVKAPMPTLEYNNENGLIFHWLYF